MPEEKEPNKWDAPELRGGVVLEGSGGSLHSPGPHRSFSYTINAGPRTGCQTIQTCDLVQKPVTQEKQLVTITASKFSMKNLGVD